MPQSSVLLRWSLASRLLLAIAVFVAASATLAGAAGLDRFSLSSASAAPGPLDDAGIWTNYANGDRINAVERDGDRLWVASDGGGIVLWEGDVEAPKQYLAPQSGLRSNVVNDVALDGDGVLWAATNIGLARYLSDEDRFDLILPENSEGMPARRATALEVIPGGDLWVGFEQEWDPQLQHDEAEELGAFTLGGLARYRPAENSWVETYHAELDGDRRQERYSTVPSENITELAYSSDGILWIGTQPYHVWDDKACGNEPCPRQQGYWIMAGGGLAAHRDDAWSSWIAADTSASCFPTYITSLAADAEGRMWVGSVGRGLLLMRNGMSVRGCETNQAYYIRPRRAGVEGGLKGNTAWSVDVGADGRVWIGQGDGTKEGLGVAILDHNNTFDDSSACECQGDDFWEYLDFEGVQGDSSTLVTTILADDDRILMGTRDHRNGDGEGLRFYDPDTKAWDAKRTADLGIPSNQISDIVTHPSDESLWVSFKNRGVARFDGQRWQGWRMFGSGERVGEVTLDSRSKFGLVQVDIPDQAAFDKHFPYLPAMIRIGGDPTVYRVMRYKPKINDSGPYLEISPKLVLPVESGAEIRLVDRGPASDAATRLAVDDDGRVWVGGRETIWLGANCPTDRAARNECWLDGGLSRWDGNSWFTYDQDNSEIPDQEVQSVLVDDRGRVWVGTGDGKSEGDGIGILDPDRDTWTVLARDTEDTGVMGSNGIGDLAQDPESGEIWAAHHPVVEYTQSLGGTLERRYIGGGVSRWNGSTWTSWTKRNGASIKAFGNDGEIDRLFVDARRDRIWAGGWVDQDQFHWILGYGINAVLNHCPLQSCAKTDWQNEVFVEEGRVSAIEADDAGHLWVGTNREGAGLIPPETSFQLFDGESWHAYSPDNSGLQDVEVTALEPEADSMWVGTLEGGLSHFRNVPPPTPTPSPEPSKTHTASPTASPSPTQTERIEPSPTRPKASSTPLPCGPFLPCFAYLPFTGKQATCLGCDPNAPEPTATDRPVPTPGPGSPTFAPTTPPPATLPPSSTPLPSETRTPTEVLPSPTASVTPTASRTPTPTRTKTPTATASPTASPTLETAAVGEWSIYDPGPLARLPRVTFYDVHATGPDNVWFVGAEGKALFWDGQELLQETLPSQDDLRSVFMLSDRKGFIAGDNGTLLEMRSGRWIRANTNGISDDWRAVHAISEDGETRGWALGADRGNRLMYDGTSWNATTPDDRNTGHGYTGVAMLGLAEAVSIQESGGGRLFDWDGERWWPGASVGAMKDVHVRADGTGVMGGDRGSVFVRGENGLWSAMSAKPATRSEPIYTVHMLSPERIFAGAGQSGVFTWDGAKWISHRILGIGRDIHGIWISEDGREGWGVGEDGLILRYESN